MAQRAPAKYAVMFTGQELCFIFRTLMARKSNTCFTPLLTEAEKALVEGSIASMVPVIEVAVLTRNAPAAL